MITYFLKADNSVKIGKTKELASRINQLQTGHPTRLELLRVSSMPEADAHRIAEKLSIRQTGEWFDATSDLIQWIASLEDLRDFMKGASQHKPLRPEWGDSREIHTRFGISKSTLYRLADEGKIRTASLREKGKLRGKRLFSVISVSDFIEAHASGGMDISPE